MKTKFLLLILCIIFNSSFIYCQNNINYDEYVKKNAKSQDSLCVELTKEYDSLKLFDGNVEALKTKKFDFVFTMNKLLFNDNFKNTQNKNEILNKFNALYPKNKISGTYFKTASDVIEYKNSFSFAYTMMLNKYLLEAIMENAKENRKKAKEKLEALEDYLIKNLTRLNISVEDYNKMTQEQKDDLWKRFE